MMASFRLFSSTAVLYRQEMFLVRIFFCFSSTSTCSWLCCQGSLVQSPMEGHCHAPPSASVRQCFLVAPAPQPARSPSSASQESSTVCLQAAGAHLCCSIVVGCRGQQTCVQLVQGLWLLCVQLLVCVHKAPQHACTCLSLCQHQPSTWLGRAHKVIVHLLLLHQTSGLRPKLLCRLRGSRAAISVLSLNPDRSCLHPAGTAKGQSLSGWASRALQQAALSNVSMLIRWTTSLPASSNMLCSSRLFGAELCKCNALRAPGPNARWRGARERSGLRALPLAGYVEAHSTDADAHLMLVVCPTAAHRSGSRSYLIL